MAQYRMSLYHRALSGGGALVLGPGHHTIRVLNGAVNIDERTVAAGDGIYAKAGTSLVAPNDMGAELLQFVVSKEAAPEEIRPLLTSEFECAEDLVVLRLDQVTFPPGAIAYRHIHPGPGIRCLLSGSLQVRSDHHVETLKPMAPWFEDANSPVKATASKTEATAFIRTMVLPATYAGKPTITYLNAEDEGKPRLQSNHRFVDQKLDFRSF